MHVLHSAHIRCDSFMALYKSDLDNILLYFNSNTYIDSDILEYECRRDTSDSGLDIYSIHKITFSYFLY